MEHRASALAYAYKIALFIPFVKEKDQAFASRRISSKARTASSIWSVPTM